jgi:predicted nucleic acid-binding protein
VILVDTSIWVDYLRRGDASLVAMLESGRVCTHPLIVGELACGNIKARKDILHLLRKLPTLPSANDDEVLFFIERHQLMGQGIGYIDAHLLAATAMAGSARLWTRDKRLATIADKLGLVEVAEKH